MKELTSDLKSSRSQALLCGDKFYFTGIPCRNGHKAKRMSLGGACYGCYEQNRDSGYRGKAQKE